MAVKIIAGDCRDVLKTLPEASVHCCVTSPPYFGLRDYGHAGQIGLEPTPAEYVEQMVQVFREVRRVLRDDGTLWLNLGDSYNAAGRTGHGTRVGFKQGSNRASAEGADNCRPSVDGLKPKDLIGIPWRVAFALQADGWYLRQDIIWSKPNPMPESVRDRCTKAHEYVFLLTKSERYYWDAEAMREPAVATDIGAMDGGAQRLPDGANANDGRNFRSKRDTFKRENSKRAQAIPGQAVGTHRAQREESGYDTFTRNKRSVWTIATQPFAEAHFATMAPALAETCIKAGCPAGGTVLDPFGGAGTTGLVADRLCRDALLVELNPEYTGIAERRVAGDAPLFASVEVQA